MKRSASGDIPAAKAPCASVQAPTRRISPMRLGFLETAFDIAKATDACYLNPRNGATNNDILSIVRGYVIPPTIWSCTMAHLEGSAICSLDIGANRVKWTTCMRPNWYHKTTAVALLPDRRFMFVGGLDANQIVSKSQRHNRGVMCYTRARTRIFHGPPLAAPCKRSTTRLVVCGASLIACDQTQLQILHNDHWSLLPRLVEETHDSRGVANRTHDQLWLLSLGIPWQLNSAVVFYDLVSAQQTRIEVPNPAAIRCVDDVVRIDDSMLFFSCWDNGALLVDQYDTRANTWSTLAPAPRPDEVPHWFDRCGETLTKFDENTVILYRDRKCLLYDARANRWTAEPKWDFKAQKPVTRFFVSR
jgi:hypothetical protein